jgi:hypothetical protein
MNMRGVQKCTIKSICQAGHSFSLAARNSLLSLAQSPSLASCSGQSAVSASRTGSKRSAAGTGGSSERRLRGAGFEVDRNPRLPALKRPPPGREPCASLAPRQRSDRSSHRRPLRGILKRAEDSALAETPQRGLLGQFRYRQYALARRICSGVRQSASNTIGEATRTQRHWAREVATLSRFRLYRNSIPRGALAWLEVVIE